MSRAVDVGHSPPKATRTSLEQGNSRRAALNRTDELGNKHGWETLEPMLKYEGFPDGRGRRVAIVSSRFNDRLVKLLTDGAIDALVRHGVSVDDITSVQVPGAMEIPLAAKTLAARGEFDAVVVLGVVIRGETSHFDYVCSACTNGVSGVTQELGVPIGFGVLTCETTAQAEERSGGKLGNKGAEAAITALEMASLLTQLEQDGAPN